MSKVGSKVFVYIILIACIAGGYFFVSDTVKKGKTKSRGVKILGGGAGFILSAFLFMVIVSFFIIRKGMVKGLNKFGDMGRTHR